MIAAQNQANEFRIRKAKEMNAIDIANVHVTSWKETYSGIIAPSYLLNLNIEDKILFWREILHFEHNRVYVAESHENGIVGFISSEIKGTVGIIHAFYVLKKFQRLKLGTRLFLKTVEFLLLNDCKNVELDVLEKNTFRKFYEKLNGKIIETRLIKIVDEEHKELIIQWDDLFSLKNQLTD